MPIITIYQGASGEGQEVAESLAQALGYRCVGRELLVEASRRYGVPEAKLNQIVEKGANWWERLLQDLRPYRIALQATLCELAHDGKVVYHGHIGHELLSGIGHVLKVLLTAPIERELSVAAFLKWLKRWFNELYDFRQPCRWQSGGFDRLLRTSESIHEKWNYIRENPVRAGLVQHWKHWPYRKGFFDDEI